ncbi:MAG: hypothetical protein HY939_06660 [Gammaproteobacteria bacterium]|nr:hypothetical protein [Gammaproteobacteria bacterium]
MMKSIFSLALAGLLLPVVCSAATTITFDNRTGQSPSTIRLHFNGGGPGPCSTAPAVKKMTGNEGITYPHQVNNAVLSDSVVAVLCGPNLECKADLYMNGNCSGDALATVTLPIGSTSTISPEVSGKYRFVGSINGVIMTCVDGTDNC